MVSPPVGVGISVRGRRFGPRAVGVVGLCAGTAAWAGVSAATAGGDPWPVVATVAVASAGYAAGVRLALIRRWAAPTVVLAAAILLALRFDVADRSPTSGPFDYVNTTAAFYMIAAIACLMIVASSRSRAVRLTGWVGAIGCAAIPIAARSAAASALVLALPATSALVGTRAPRFLSIALGGLIAATLLATIALGATYHPRRESGRLQDFAITALSERRLSLWHDALGEMRAHPIVGVGPGDFADESPTARSDRDARDAHNGFLQQGAEIGIPGLALTVGLFGMALGAAGSSRPDTFSALAMAAVAALAVASCIDHVLHVSTVSVASLLTGAAAAPARPSAQSVEEEN